jgi:hypothetical protein
MDGRSQRLSAPLTPRAKRMMAAVGVLAVAGLGGTAVWGVGHQDAYGPSRNGCITVSVASSTGGALLHDCGAGARAACRNAFAGRDNMALLTQRQCRLAGLGPVDRRVSG